MREGEVLALIGENGAGKSTLMKTLGGIVQPDEGEILVDGRPVTIPNVNRAAELGIAFIHQELNVLDNLDVAGNIFLGREPSRFGLIDRARMRADTKALLERLDLPIGVDTPLTRLSLAQRQTVEIAKALSLDARVLIMDEPTSSLTGTETARLLEIVRDLRARGVGVVYISHRLGEVREIADRVVGLKDGQNAGDLSRDEITHDAMVRLMVGRDIARTPPAPGAGTGPIRMEVRGLRTARYPGREVSLDLRGGEILGLAGLVGAGRSELAQAIFGTDPALGGAVTLDGAPLRLGDPHRAIVAGVGLVPEDRRAVGLIVEWAIGSNITLPTLDEFASRGFVRRGVEREAATRESQALGVKAPNVDVLAQNLSGGNQQKVVLGKWLTTKPKVLILDEPTRGVDVGAKDEIYAIMRALASDGVAILMISSDMEEVLGVSDRIGVMHEGALVGELPRTEATEEAIMNLAVGSAAHAQ